MEPVDEPGAAVLRDQRATVLQISRFLLWGVGLPAMAILVGLDASAGNWSPWLAAEAAVALATGVLVQAFRREPRLCATFLTSGSGLMFALGLVQYGPLFGTGLMFVVWAILVVLFHGRVLLPTVAAGGTMFFVMTARSQGWLDAPWESPAGGVMTAARMALTTAVMTYAVAFLMHRLLCNLVDAVRDEAQARVAEAQAQAERAAAAQALARSQHLETLGRLTGGAAHDFNNSLMVVMGGLEVLRHDTAGETRDEVLQEMTAALEGALTITRQLLTFSRQGSSPGETAAPRHSVELLGRSLRRLLPENIHVETEAEDAPDVVLSSGELQRALLNLGLNARDAMTDGGKLILRCRPDAAGERVVFEVTDTGAGMDQETQRRVLEPFFTTKDGDGGTGLGLSMVRDTVEKAGGELQITSAPGEGTTIRLEIPRAPTASPRPLSALPRATAEPRTTTALLLEDDDLVRKVISRILTTGGIEAVPAASTEDARRRMAEGDHDILISDGMLPDGPPTEILQHFRDQGRPIIVISGYLRDQVVLGDFADEEVAFLQKPVSSHKLLDAIDDALTQALERSTAERDPGLSA